MNKFGVFWPFRRFLTMFVLAHFAHHLVNALLIPLLPFIRNDFALNYTQTGFVMSAFILSYGLAQWPGGWLADHIGRHITAAIGISGSALCGLMLGLSPNFTMVIVFLVLLGLLGGGYHPSASPLVSGLVEPKNRGRALGFHLIGGSIAFVVAPLLAAVISATWGWRGTFITLAAPALIFGIIFYMVLRRWGAKTKREPTTVSNNREVPDKPGRIKHLAPVIILITFTQAVVFSTISFIPLFIVDHFHVEESTAAASIALVWTAGLWAAPLGGYLSDRVGRLPVVLLACLFTGPIVYLLNFVSYGFGTNAILIAIGMLMVGRIPAAEAYIIEKTSEQNRSTVLGIYCTGTENGGLLLGAVTPIMGHLIDRFGFYTSFTYAGVFLFIVTIACSMYLWTSRT